MTPVPHRTFVIILALAAFAFGAAVLWDTQLKERFFPRDWGVVEEGAIYRSGQISRHIIDQTLRDHHIALIVFLSADNPNRPDVQTERQAAARLGIPRINCPLAGDGTGSIEQYANAIAAVAHAVSAGKPVLVHCATGAQRTGALVAFWRVLVRHQSPQDAYRELLQYHHDPNDNQRLLPYLNGNMATLAQMLVDRHIIQSVPDPIPVICP